MSQVTNFEDLIAWQKARVLTRDVYRLAAQPKIARDFGLSDQMRRAAVSIMSNVAEGFERGSSADFHRFLTIAKASCAELRSQLYVALDVGYVEVSDFDVLRHQCLEVSKILGALRTSVARQRDGGGGR